MAVNWYARAMDLMVQGCDSGEVILEVAKRHPSVLVRSIEAIDQRKREASEPWRREFSELVQNGQMVSAIKLHREKTGSLLKYAKKAHDDERARLFGEGVV